VLTLCADCSPVTRKLAHLSPYLSVRAAPQARRDAMKPQRTLASGFPLARKCQSASPLAISKKQRGRDCALCQSTSSPAISLYADPRPSRFMPIRVHLALCRSASISLYADPCPSCSFCYMIGQFLNIFIEAVNRLVSQESFRFFSDVDAIDCARQSPAIAGKRFYHMRDSSLNH
jgi:hypothetical protein